MSGETRILAKRTGSLKSSLAILNRCRSRRKDLQRSVEENGMQRILTCARATIASDNETLPADSPVPSRQLTDGPELIAVPKSQITHVSVEVLHLYRLQPGPLSCRSQADDAKPASVRSPRMEPTTCSDHAAPWSNLLWIENVRSFGS